MPRNLRETKTSEKQSHKNKSRRLRSEGVGDSSRSETGNKERLLQETMVAGIGPKIGQIDP
jgi:hypothetical protein